jgi:signal transduction histidine kinase
MCENDERRLQQVLMNLLNNSIKFTKPQGKISLEVSEFITHNLIYIQIKDNGIGMSPDIINQIC